MSMGAGGKEGQSLAEINMTPLIDVMLVLLIIFIINVPQATHAVKIDNPLPPPPGFVPPPPPEVIDLSITMAGSASGDGGVAFGSVLMSFAEAVLGTDDARLTGRSQTAWEAALAAGHGVRLETVGLDVFAKLAAFPRWYQQVQEAFPDGMIPESVYVFLAEQTETIMQRLGLPSEAAVLA